MMEWLKTWLLSIVAASVCLSLLHSLSPNGAVRSIARISGGLVLFLVMVQPLTGLDAEELRLRYVDYQQQIDEQIEAYREDYYGQLEKRIEGETGAYISEKAAQMGLVCSPKVESQAQDGVPIPSEVTLDLSKDQVLSAWIAQEIGIDAEHQHWEEKS